MSLRRTFNSLFSFSKYRLCTVGEERALQRSKRSPFEVIARREGAKGVKMVFDVGANIGQTTKEIRGYFPWAMIHAFEPTPASREEFEAAWGGDEKVKLWPLAVSAAPGQATFYVNERSMTNSLLPTDMSSAEYVGESNVKNVESISVEMTTIDGFCEEQGIEELDILKLDIQGSELDALKGAERMLGERRVKYICLEAGFLPLYEDEPLYTEIAEFLAEKGYPVYGLFKLARHESDRLIFADAMFFAGE